MLSAHLLVGLAVAYSSSARGADNDGGAPQQAQSFKVVRYLEDYRSLASATTTDFWDPVKYVQLSPGSYLSFGGQHRLQYEFVNPQDLGRRSVARARSVLLSRNLLHVDMHPLHQLRVFAQFGGYYALGADTDPEPPDADRADVAQLFFESGAKLGALKWSVRVGRQEMPLGSTKWIGVRDGTNVRQSFDIVRITLQGEKERLDLFGGVAPKLRSGAFDDAPDPRNRFWGVYGTLPLIAEQLLALDVFYIGRMRGEATYREVKEREVRHTFGLRLFGSAPFGLEYIQHALLQVGTLGDTSILAWALATGLWQRFPGRLKAFRIGIRGDALSGDSHDYDGRVSTFQPLFPNQSYFAALAAIYPTNLYDIHPLMRYEQGEISVEAGAIFFWRQTVHDSVYVCCQAHWLMFDRADKLMGIVVDGRMRARLDVDRHGKRRRPGRGAAGA